MKTFTYNWLHIPSGKIGVTTVEEEYLLEFRHSSIYMALNSWNCSNPGIWQYWISPVEALGKYK